MSNLKYLSIIMLIGFLSQSCDKIDQPYENLGNTPVTNPSDSDSTVVIRKMLIEEYTGQGCGNCPGAAVEIQNLINANENQLIAVSIHSGWFADPSGPGNPFTTDFTNSTGDAFYNTFSVTNNPIASINRNYSLNQGILLGKNDWSPTISQLKDSLPTVKITLHPTYTIATRTLDLSVDCEFLSGMYTDLNLTVLLVEDSIIDDQENYLSTGDGDPNYPDGHVTNYVHRHVLRGSIGNTWGELVATDTTTIGTTVTKNYSYPLNATWNESHCLVVAFVAGSCQAPPTDCEIIQVEEAHVIE